MTTQTDVIAFLSSPAAFPAGDTVEVIETHGALVFLCGEVALKLKRAVTYDYMDLSTVDLRRAMLTREITLNAPFAPSIYRDVLPVTRTEDGFTLAGDGPVVDWVLRMWRFPAEDELEEIAERGALGDDLASAMGQAVAAYHMAVPVIRRPGAVLIGDILDELQRVFAEFAGVKGTERIAHWMKAVRATWKANAAMLDARGISGHVRRAHGDLHLRNLVLIDGKPTLFDALEFDETLGTCDVLYDLAFLIMDLCHRGLQQQGCRVLDAWLREARGHEDSGLAALPLFLSVRAAIRAMVLLQTDAARKTPDASAGEIASYMDLACMALQKQQPSLVAIGGYSASGKSVLARTLAPHVGPLPGAVLLASDLERKAGRPKNQPLSEAKYSPDQRAAVYRQIFERAATLLKAGQSVVLDATFLQSELRLDAAEIASEPGVPFHGLWLQAPPEILEDRIRKRSKGPSDATIEVLRRQLAAPPGDLGWHQLDAAGDPLSVHRSACAVLGVG